MSHEDRTPQRQTNAGETVPPDTAQAGENVCRRCAGSGNVNGRACDECGGTGKVMTTVGDA